MTTRFDNPTITAYDRIQTTLEALRIVAGALVEQAATLADCKECHSNGQDEFGQPNNTVADLLSTLGYDINQRIHQTREAIQADLHVV